MSVHHTPADFTHAEVSFHPVGLHAVMMQADVQVVKVGGAGRPQFGFRYAERVGRVDGHSGEFGYRFLTVFDDDVGRGGRAVRRDCERNGACIDV